MAQLSAVPFYVFPYRDSGLVQYLFRDAKTASHSTGGYRIDEKTAE